jgi:hypothetical protein
LCYGLIAQPVYAQSNEPAPLFPFVITGDTGGNVTDVSAWNDAPAGKYGFIRVEDGKFFNDNGRFLIWGTNTSFSANFPEHADAEKVAARLARLGFNCLRLHHMDMRDIWGEEAGSLMVIDPGQMEKLDYFIYQLKMRGIYVNLNLHVSRKMDERDGFPDKDKRPQFDKGLDNFYPPFIELQKQYARDLLEHVNPYTKTAYKDEPAIAMIEINNENSVVVQWARFGNIILNMPPPYSTEFQKQWNDFLSGKYRTTAALINAWELGASTGLQQEQSLEAGTIPLVDVNGTPFSPIAANDFCEFLFAIEEKYWIGMYRYIKDEIGAKQPVCGTQLQYGSTTIQTKLDYTDSHSYWNNRTYPGERFDDDNWYIANRALANNLDEDLLPILATRRPAGRPHTVSEFNAPFPNRYEADAYPILAAFGRFQDWDGIFQFSYGGRRDGGFDVNMAASFLDLVGHPTKLAHMPACAAMFRRGDVAEGETLILGGMDAAKEMEIFKRIKTPHHFNFRGLGIDPKTALSYRTAIDVTGKQTKKIPDIISESSYGITSYASETGQLLALMSKEENKSRYIVNTPNTKVFTGFFPDEEKRGADGKSEDYFDDLNIEDFGKTRLGWATISIVSVNGNGFDPAKAGGEPVRVLVTATGWMQNTDMAIEYLDDENFTLRNPDGWGKGPTLCEGIPFTLRFYGAKSLKCFSLDENGNRREEITTESNEVCFAPRYKTLWYEIEIK